jgi:hypothetical protein
VGTRASTRSSAHTREADQARLADQAMDRQLRAEKERNFVRPKTRLNKMGENG